MTGDSVFGNTYAASYDLFYAGKDYAAECDVLELMFSRHGTHRVQKILDLGCGTGRHACLLAARGYDVVGVDRSDHMLRSARSRALESGVSVTFLRGDIRDAAVGASFDAALMMFAVLGYQITDDSLHRTLTNVRRQLNDGGLLVFDAWYAPAVITQAPEERWRLYQGDHGAIVRYSHGTLRADAPICAVDIEVWSVAPGRQATDHARERHEMRFFSKPELEKMLLNSGFELLEFAAFPQVDRTPDESTWNVLAVTRAV